MRYQCVQLPSRFFSFLFLIHGLCCFFKRGINYQIRSFVPLSWGQYARQVRNPHTYCRSARFHEICSCTCTHSIFLGRGVHAIFKLPAYNRMYNFMAVKGCVIIIYEGIDDRRPGLRWIAPSFLKGQLAQGIFNRNISLILICPTAPKVVGSLLAVLPFCILAPTVINENCLWLQSAI